VNFRLGKIFSSAQYVILTKGCAKIAISSSHSKKGREWQFSDNLPKTGVARVAVEAVIAVVIPAIYRSQFKPMFELANVGWGARIRTWDGGTKNRSLTTWRRPNTHR
jgi:hypothetical protein